MYTVREVSSVLGISIARLRSYLRSGIVVPTKSEDGQIRFSFEDLIFLRKAEGLVAQRIPPRRVHDALRALAGRLPDGVKVTGLRLLGDGKDVIVDEGRTRWDALSGQTLFDFEDKTDIDENSDDGAEVVPLGSRIGSNASDPPPGLSVNALFERACVLEATAPDQAGEAYRAVLEREPNFADAHVNLGRILHEAGDIYAALVHYRAALAIRPADATAAFNAGVALEDLGATTDAIIAYRRAIESDPRNPDAHYNLARLLEQTGKPDVAIRHLLLYRQLIKKQ